MQKWLDQNHTSRSAKPSSAPSAAVKRALASARNVSRTTLRSSGLGSVASSSFGTVDLSGSAIPMARWRSSASRLATIWRARRSARNSKDARTACALVIRLLPMIRPMSGRSSSANNAPRASEAIAAIEPRRGPRQKRCRASAAANFGSSDINVLTREINDPGARRQSISDIEIQCGKVMTPNGVGQSIVEKTEFTTFRAGVISSPA